MESLGRFWYYLKATQGPHCCMFNYRTAENSSRGQDIWREVPGRLNGAANLIVIVARRSKQCRGCLFFCQLSSQLWSLPGIFLLEIVCEFSHFQESWDVAMSALLGTRPSNSCTFCKKHYLSPLTLLTSLVFVNNGLSNIDFWLSKPEVCLK